MSGGVLRGLVHVTRLNAGMKKPAGPKPRGFLGVGLEALVSPYQARRRRAATKPKPAMPNNAKVLGSGMALVMKSRCA